MTGPALLLLLASVHPWPHRAETTLVERYPPPAGHERVDVEARSFGAWLRTLPVQPGRGVVRLHDGSLKRRQDVHHAVLDLDVGKRDLQQCADFAFRLHAEWSRAQGRAPCYLFTSGHRARWSDWQEGLRPKIKGAKVSWQKSASPSSSRRQFRRYLDVVFSYAGSASLERDTLQVRADDISPGDLLVQGGHPGHVVVILDVAHAPTGEREVLLGQSYMPAQSPHVLRSPTGGAWFPAPEAGAAYVTPEWTFPPESLRRFSPDPCRATRPPRVR